MRPTHGKQCTLPFGFIADILFQIIINGEASTILTLCLLNEATYDTIKVLEPSICTWFMCLRGIDTFDPLLTVNPWTGKQNALTVHTLVRSLYRHDLARRLSLHIVPSVWGPFYDDDKVELNFEAELKLAQRLERGLHVLFHMADISRETKREQQSQKRNSTFSSSISKHLTLLTKLLDESTDLNLDFHRNQTRDKDKDHAADKTQPSPTVLSTHTKAHLTTVLKWAQAESEIGHRRLEFRTTHLDSKSEIAFHCTLRMLRELLERMLLRHGPKCWHRDTRNEYSVVSWFLLNQGPRSLARLFLTPQDECCNHHHHHPHYHHHHHHHIEAGPDMSTGTKKCLFSNPLDEYWDAWKDTDLGYVGPSMDMGMDIDMSLSIRIGKYTGTGPSAHTATNPITSPDPACDCKRRVRSWSVKPALFDNRGREYNRAAERHLKEMWSQRHMGGLHQTFTIAGFVTVL